jgi:hypothetical protein
VRYHAVTLQYPGERGRTTVHYTEHLASNGLEIMLPIVCLPPTISIKIPMPAGQPELRIKWTPDPDGTAVLNFYGGPAEEDMITTCVLLPRGRQETRALAETIQVFLPRLDFGLSDLPDGPTLLAIPWPNVKHLDAMAVVRDVELCLAGAFFLNRRHDQN